MSFEIVYTSARRGLMDGTRGFCTVAATEAIPRVLHERLESLSGYRHAFPVNTHLNPINYSHLIVRVQGEAWHVLSRVADAGNDYSGRSNKIAHHLAMGASELPAATLGPVELLADPLFWFAEWERSPTQLEHDRQPVAHASGNDRYNTWRQVFGDCGWAGLLAGSVQEEIEPASVIVPPGCDTLSLMSEAMRLVPPQERWKVCFSTYFTRLAANSECHWRFVLDDTEEARKLRARPTTILIDPLGGKQRLPESDPLVVAAREGTAPVVASVSAAESRVASVRQSGTRQAAARRPRRSEAGGGGGTRPSQMRRRRAGERARRQRLAGRARSEPEAPTPVAPVAAPPEPEVTGRGKRFWILVTASILLLGLLGFVAKTVFLDADDTESPGAVQPADDAQAELQPSRATKTARDGTKSALS